MISIKGLDKVKVFQALYNRSRPLGMGMLHYQPGPLSDDAAAKICGIRGDDTSAMFGTGGRPGSFKFDYVLGRVMKVDLSKDEFDPWLYDRDNGQGAAQEAISKAFPESEAA